LSLSEVLLPFCVYLLPMLFLFYMGVDILLRNPRKAEHRLVSLTIACYFLLFMEEYIRYQLPMSYSPKLAAVWFASVGMTVPGLSIHFIAKFVGLDKRMSKWLYPYVFHLPLLMIPVNILCGQKLISAQDFLVTGPWKLPVYNTAYYTALTTCWCDLFRAPSAVQSDDRRGRRDQWLGAGIRLSRLRRMASAVPVYLRRHCVVLDA
jgi:hypothetical protein